MCQRAVEKKKKKSPTYLTHKCTKCPLEPLLKYVQWHQNGILNTNKIATWKLGKRQRLLWIHFFIRGDLDEADVCWSW